MISLDTILIPGDKNENVMRGRTNRAIDYVMENNLLEEKSYLSGLRIVVSGGKTLGLENPKYKSEAHVGYEELRKVGIKPSQMRIDSRAKNTIQNILNSTEKILGDKIGVVTNYLQFLRINYIIKTARKKGLIDKEFETVNIRTPFNMKETFYEILAWPITIYSLMGKDIREERGFEKILKRIAKYFHV